RPLWTDSAFQLASVILHFSSSIFYFLFFIFHFLYSILHESLETKMHIRVAWLFVFVLAAAPQAHAQGGKIFPYPIRQDALDNGLRVISVPFDSPGIIAY